MQNDLGNFFDEVTKDPQNYVEDPIMNNDTRNNIEQNKRTRKNIDENNFSDNMFSDIDDFDDFSEQSDIDQAEAIEDAVYGETEQTKGFFQGLVQGVIGLFSPKDTYFPPVLPPDYKDPEDQPATRATNFDLKYGEDFKEKNGDEKHLFFMIINSRAQRDSRIKLDDFNPKDDMDKLGLILEGQIKGLDTSIYKNFNADQITQIMAAQLEGFSLEDISKIADPKISADKMQDIRQKIEIKKGMDRSTVVSYNNVTKLNVHSKSLNDIIKEAAVSTRKDMKAGKASQKMPEPNIPLGEDAR